MTGCWSRRSSKRRQETAEFLTELVISKHKSDIREDAAHLRLVILQFLTSQVISKHKSDIKENAAHLRFDLL